MQFSGLGVYRSLPRLLPEYYFDEVENVATEESRPMRSFRAGVHVSGGFSKPERAAADLGNDSASAMAIVKCIQLPGLNDKTDL